MNKYSLTCLLYFCLHFLQSGAVRPVIIEKIVDEVKPVDGTATLNCTVALFDNSEMNVEWWRLSDNKLLSQGTRIPEAQNPKGPGDVPKYEIILKTGRTEFIPDMGYDSIRTFALLIRRLVNTDAGLYRCRIYISGSPGLSPAVVGRLVVPREPFITSSLITQNQVVEEGHSVTLRCIAEAEPAPRISWTRASGEPLNLPDLGYPQRVYKEEVTIRNVSKTDRGVYRCHANNNVGQGATFDVRINVQYKPLVRVARKNGKYGQAPDRNFEISLECITDGFPDPDVQFYRGYLRENEEPKKENILTDTNEFQIERLRSQGAVGLKIDEIFYVLKIRNVRSDMFMNYTCIAANKFGRTLAHLEFFRQEVCQGPICYGSQGSSPSDCVKCSKMLLLCVCLYVLFSRIRS